MRTFKWTVAAATVLAVGLLMASLPAASQQPPTRTTLTLFDPNKTEHEKDIDEGRKGFSPGDWAVFREKQLDPQTCEKAGTVVGRFVFVEQTGRENGRFIIDLGVILPDGRLSAYGTGKFSAFEQEGGFKFAVTGGTDAYKDATGEATLVEDQRLCDTRGALITIDLLLEH